MSSPKERASCQHLTHKYASFHGCTLGEMWLILGICGLIEVPSIMIVSVFLSPYLGGYFGAMLLLFLGFSLLTFFVLLKQVALSIGRLRKGRPAGYLTLKARKILHQFLGFSLPYVTRNGTWITRRRMP